MTLPNELHPGFLASAGGGADLGDTIEESLRFRGSHYLYRNATTPTDATKFTLSFWIKRGQMNSAYQTVMYAGVDAQNKNDALWFYPYAIELNQRRSNVDYQTTTNALFRDPTAWYHVVYTWSSGTRIIYVNGDRQTFSRNNTTTATHYWQTNGRTIEIGRDTNNGGSPANYSEFYLAAFHFIDGQALNATDFGKYNEDDVWVPQDYTGTHGNNGFYLKFDSSGYNGSGGIGADHSGNGNDFTASGFIDDSSGNTYNDVDYFDTPTSNYAVWNPVASDGTNITLSEANLKIGTNSSATANWEPGYLTFGPFECGKPGKYYFEMNDTAGAGYLTCNFGVTDTFKTDWSDFWWNTGDTLSWYPEAGTAYRNGGSAFSFGTGSTSGGKAMAIDFENGTVDAYSGGTLVGSLTGSSSNLTPGVKYYIVAGTSKTGGTALPFNFGQNNFLFTPPSGYKALQTNNLSTPTIKDGSDHFQAIIAGPTTTVDVSTEIGGDFSPYVTSNTGAWYGTAVPAGMFDGTLSGYTQTNDASGTSTITFIPATPIPYTSSVEIYFGGPNVSLNGGANQTPAINQWSTIATGSGTITSLVFTGGYGGTVYGIKVDSKVLVDRGPLPSAQAAFPNGFYWIKDRENSSTQHQLVDTIRGTSIAKIIPTNGAQTSYSAPSGGSVAWCWKSGEPAVNGFNMFQYTGNSSSTQAIAHGLPGTPKFIISFSQSANSGVAVHHTKLPSGEILNLDSSSAPTSSTRYSSVDATNITFGGDYNTDGENYMCYAWTPIESYSKFDVYTGNTSADGPFIYLGFKPSWILLKRDDIANWRIFDSSRNQYNPMDLMLWPNLSDAEGTDPYGSGDVVDFLSNGFKIRATGTTMNANDSIYYVAFAESPFGGENVPPATAR